MRQLGVQMHGVTLNLQCNYDKLLDHTADLLDGHTCPPWASPDLAVTAHWLHRPSPDEPGPLADTAGLDGFGKRILLSEEQLLWTDVYRDKDLQLRFAAMARRSPSTWSTGMFRPPESWTSIQTLKKRNFSICCAIWCCFRLPGIWNARAVGC